jgi:hypothetical protein
MGHFVKKLQSEFKAEVVFERLRYCLAELRLSSHRPSLGGKFVRYRNRRAHDAHYAME